jgi:uncharacterized protein (DUF697 family)
MTMKAIGYLLLVASGLILGMTTGFSFITLIPFVLAVAGGQIVGMESMADTYEKALDELFEEETE